MGLINRLMVIGVPNGVAVHAAGFEKAKFKGFPVPTKNGMGRQGPMPFATEGMMGQTPSGV